MPNHCVNPIQTGDNIVKYIMVRDAFHNAVRHALEKDGWKITHDPLKLALGTDTTMLIDLGAERLLVAERNMEYIAVEVKGFTETSNTHEFHSVLGQYLNYRAALRILYPDHKLYLAVPDDVFQTFFQRQFTQIILKEFMLNILVYNAPEEVIVSEELF
jgi:XisH protein